MEFTSMVLVSTDLSIDIYVPDSFTSLSIIFLTITTKAAARTVPNSPRAIAEDATRCSLVTFTFRFVLTPALALGQVGATPT